MTAKRIHTKMRLAEGRERVMGSICYRQYNITAQLKKPGLSTFSSHESQIGIEIEVI
jgi:hypothetical protein